MLESLDLEADFEAREYDEYDEYDEFSEYDEAVRPRFRPAPLRTAPRGNPMASPTRQGHATRAELDATAKRLDGRIATNATAIKTLDRRTHAAEAEMGRISAALKKEIVIRKRQTTEVKKSIDESRQIAMIMPMLTANAAPGDKFAAMLPVLMYGGMLGGSGPGGGAGNGDNSNMMMMVLAMTMMNP